jgi:elongation factor P
MIINATQLRVGMIINHEGELYRISYMMHVTPGKGVACVQTKLKNILTGKNLEQRFRSNDRVEKAELETHEMQFLYKEPSGYVFMDNESYEQSTLPQDLLGTYDKYLKEGQTYVVNFYQGTAVGIIMPTSIDLKVTMAPPEIKRATATNSLRPVTLENGMEVNAPGFIKSGDIIKVNIETDEYIERV